MLLAYFGMIFGAQKSKDFEICFKKRKSEKAIEFRKKTQKEKRSCQYLWYTPPKKQNFLEDGFEMFSCIQESLEEKEDRTWEGDSKKMLEIFEKESETEKNRSPLLKDFVKDSYCVLLDEENHELITIYLHHTLMDIGVRQTEKDINPQCRACGDPHVPWHFLRSYDFNSTVDAKGRSFLTRAIRFRHKELINLLLLVGVDINRPDERGVLPLKEAFESDRSVVSKNNDEESMVRFLVERGARIASV